MSLYQEMVSEFKRLGGITIELKERVLASGDKELIALLADEENFK